MYKNSRFNEKYNKLLYNSLYERGKFMKNYEYFEVTADIGFKAYGNNLNEAFENASIAMFNIITDTSNVAPSKEIELKIKKKAGKLLTDIKVFDLYAGKNILQNKKSSNF